ncbi:MAG: hypothetical protein HYV07_32250 [Deltaproteobacteria bacterium]|nr:hypothetical protein [Deltaproteobacteria bacterium]
MQIRTYSLPRVTPNPLTSLRTLAAAEPAPVAKAQDPAPAATPSGPSFLQSVDARKSHLAAQSAALLRARADALLAPGGQRAQSLTAAGTEVEATKSHGHVDEQGRKKVAHYDGKRPIWVGHEDERRIAYTRYDEKGTKVGEGSYDKRTGTATYTFKDADSDYEYRVSQNRTQDLFGLGTVQKRLAGSDEPWENVSEPTERKKAVEEANRSKTMPSGPRT